MQYINKSTGEVYNVQVVDLGNICDGSLNRVFVHELQKLTRELTLDSKPGCITLKVKVDKDLTPSGETILRIEASIATKYPSMSIFDDTTKNITDDGQIVERIPTSLFDNEPEQDATGGEEEQ